MYQLTPCGSSVPPLPPVLKDIALYIQCNPYLFGAQLAGTVLVAALSLRLGHILQHMTTESLHGAKPGNGWGKPLGRIVYFSVLGMGLLLIVGIWSIGVSWDQARRQLSQEVSVWLPNIGLTLLVVALMLSIGRAMQRASLRRMTQRRVDINLSLLVSRMIYLATLGVGVLLILLIWGVQLFVPVTVLGAITVAITFAIQDILKNLVAGVYLLVERPFRIGDEIMVDKYTGRVEDIHMRITTLRTTSGEQVLIPNAILFSAAVINTTAYRRRRALLTVVLPTEGDMTPEACEQKILEALKPVEGILTDPPPDIRVSSAADQKITLAVHFWVPTDRLDLLSDALFHVKRALPSAEVSLPGVAGVS